MSTSRRLARLAVAHVRQLQAASLGQQSLRQGANVGASEVPLLSAPWSLQSAPLHPLLWNALFSASTKAEGLASQWAFAGRSFTTTAAQAANAGAKKASEEAAQRDNELQQAEDPFDTITDQIPEKPVSVAEGASYTVVIVAFLGVAAAAMFYVAKELLLEPKEYKVFNKALDRVKDDSQVTVRIGRPITGYGSESRNRAARQRIRHNITKDEDGTERIQVQFFIRGPNGTGMVTTEMFKDRETRDWQFTYLIVDITSPVPHRLMLESYLGGAAG